MKRSRTIQLRLIALIAATAILSTYLFGCINKKPPPLTDPIPEKIKKGDIVVGVVERFQLPKTTDPVKKPATTSAYARLQYIKPVGDDSGKLAVCDLRGQLYLLYPKSGSVRMYLDLNAYPLSSDTSTMPNETGLGGFAFHPDFSKKGELGYGKFYTGISVTSGSGKANYHKEANSSHESVVLEWSASDHSKIPFEGTYREIFRVGQFAPNHSIGTLAFKPTAQPGSDDYGNLYFCLGDGGAGFDPMDYGQSMDSPHGAILRINPLVRTGSRNYGIPEDNPFVFDTNVAPEIWAYGLRHPQQFSWDENGRMFINDIGQNQVEEVNIGQAGANYGWRIREGTFATGSNIDQLSVGPVYNFPADPADNFVGPVAQYDHDEGRAIGSGFAYTGNQIEALKGKYLFADIVRGRIFYIDTKDLLPGNPAEIRELRLSFDGEEKDLLDLVGYPNTYHPGMRADLRLGIDDKGEVFLVTKGDGKVRQLVPLKPM
tara:strand:- start:1250 stop:2710 length:1461 start_codon:yes stop_codon:yes gene_type:complete